MKSDIEHTTIAFNLDGGDPSVGIFGENFSAWRVKPSAPMVPVDSCWCDLAEYNEDFARCTFVWHDNITSDECIRPKFATVVERALHGYAVGVYASEEEFYESACEDVSEDRPLPCIAEEKDVR